MEIENSSTSTRKPRADGQRNRDLIVRVAKEAFAENGAGASLDDIAKKAGVGPGTLYRHFPTREDLFEAVYRAEVEKLAEAAVEFGRTLSPLEAIRAWLFLFIDYLATKKIISAGLGSLVSVNRVVDENKPKVHGAVKSIFERAVEAGEIRADVDPVGIVLAIVGVTFFGTTEDWRKSAESLVDILIQGSRPQN